MPKTKFQISTVKWGSLAHNLLNVALVLSMAVLVFSELTPLAVILVFISKWRVFAVQPRHWLVNLRSNSPDIIVGLSFVSLLSHAETTLVSSAWMLLYGLWLVVLKPQSAPGYVGLQALTSLFLGLTSLFWLSDIIPETLIVLGSWFIASVSAQHYLNSFDEPLSRVISGIWALFIAQMAWLLNRWLIVYPVTEDVLIPQIAVVATVVGYVLASLYYLDQAGKLKHRYKQQYILVGTVLLFVIILFSNWTNEL